MIDDYDYQWFSNPLKRGSVSREKIPTSLGEAETHKIPDGMDRIERV